MPYNTDMNALRFTLRLCVSAEIELLMLNI
jgi:hypothetical protein